MIKSSETYYPSNETERTFINKIWRLSEEDLQTRKEIILPKGTVEVIFNFSEAVTYFKPAYTTEIKLPIVFVNGVNFTPFELIKTGDQKFIGIQLNSIGLRLLFNISPKELNNTVCNGVEVCSNLYHLADELFHEKMFDHQVQIILSWIRKKITWDRFQHAIIRAQKLLSYYCASNLTVKQLSSNVGLSERQLWRVSQDWLGMNTEEFILYSKYLSSLYLLHHSTQNLTAIGLQAGYYDQSHFIREFKSYTNLTPRQYRGASSEYPGHILLQ